ncbi:hypothetical protein ABT186_01740 [Streptomyces sp. NPDC001634]|uniref:hypothetical protein n=1 Tax=Streptomyces sp. NPDC001634 TaxID=3154390 RepID=UPI003317FB1C
MSQRASCLGQIELPIWPDPAPTLTSCACTPPVRRPCGHCTHCDTCLDCGQCAGSGHDHECED